MKFLIALYIMLKSHINQKDKAGKPYIYHPLIVMRAVKGYKTKIVALLHDVVEDSNYTIEQLKKIFDNDIIEAIDLLTKKKKQDYFEYLNAIKRNEIAKKVKISDLKHNMDLKRLSKINDNDLKRFEKYKKSLEFLTTN